MNAIAPTLNDRTSFRLPVRIAVVLCIICALAFSMAVPASAATTTIEEVINDSMEQALNLLRVIVTPIATIGFVANRLIIRFGGQRGMETGKKGVLICVLAIAAVWLAPLIIKTIASWFEGVGDFGVFDTTSS